MSKIYYGMGQTNIDPETEIRCGVIPVDMVKHWVDESEAEYGEPTCPDCSVQLLDRHLCETCDEHWEPEDCFPESPAGYTYTLDGIEAFQDRDDMDIFITKSPFYTRAKLCSPYAPDACYLPNPEPAGEKAYCLGHDWFGDEGAPYPVFRVDNNAQVIRYAEMRGS